MHQNEARYDHAVMLPITKLQDPALQYRKAKKTSEVQVRLCFFFLI